MIKYVDVSPLEVVYETEKGRTVYCADKNDKEVYVLNDFDFAIGVETLKDAKENPGRYVFWYEEKEPEAEETEEEVNE